MAEKNSLLPDEKKTSIADTPEFKMALADALAKAIPEAIAKAAPSIVAAAVEEVGKLHKPVAGLDTASADFFANMSQTIALAVAEISDQGTSRKRVAPEILAKRAAATKLCHELIAKAHEKGLKPEYRVRQKVYFNERLIEPYRRLADKTIVAQEIIWTGIPNDSLEPLNEVAIDIFNAYRESVGSNPHLGPIRHINGGIVAPDNRPHWMTPGGLVVKGDAPAKLAIGNEPKFENDLGFKQDADPNAPFVHVLGTVHTPARRNANVPQRTV